MSVHIVGTSACLLLLSFGALRAKGLAMGVTESDNRHRNKDDALVRRRLFLANLKCVSGSGVLVQLILSANCAAACRSTKVPIV